MSKVKQGRPSVFTQELADEICLRLADGQSLREICKAEDMPSRRTVHRWLFKDKAFCHQYTQARESQADRIIEDLLHIADTTTPEMVNVAKLRLDARKFYITKVAPKRFGDKVTQEITGANGGAIEINSKNDLRSMTDEQLQAIINGTVNKS